MSHEDNAKEGNQQPRAIGADHPMSEPAENSFSNLAEQQDPGIVSEFVDFLKYNKKWWLTPILVITLILVAAAILLPSPVAPFIYTFF